MLKDEQKAFLRVLFCFYFQLDFGYFEQHKATAIFVCNLMSMA